MTQISTLNALFGIPSQANGQITFESAAGRVIVNINNQYAEARFSLQGGQLLSWQPKHEKDVIWLSEDTVFADGCSIRGGVPICWPWFGAHATNKVFPSHGYARTQDWQVTETKVLSDGSTFMALRLLQQAVAEEHRMFDTDLELQVKVGKKFEMALITRNSGKNTITIGEAFHTYFNISDITEVTIRGLENQTFIDALDQWQRKNEVEPITINAEIDRIYLDSPDNECVIVDTEFKRRIRISKQGSHSTVVWNPWIDKSEKLGDMGNEGYKKMVCVESSNAADDVIVIEPGGEHCLSVCYEIEPIN